METPTGHTLRHPRLCALALRTSNQKAGSTPPRPLILLRWPLVVRLLSCEALTVFAGRIKIAVARSAAQHGQCVIAARRIVLSVRHLATWSADTRVEAEAAGCSYRFIVTAKATRCYRLGCRGRKRKGRRSGLPPAPQLRGPRSTTPPRSRPGKLVELDALGVPSSPRIRSAAHSAPQSRAHPRTTYGYGAPSPAWQQAW